MLGASLKPGRLCYLRVFLVVALPGVASVAPRAVSGRRAAELDSTSALEEVLRQYERTRTRSTSALSLEDKVKVLREASASEPRPLSYDNDIIARASRARRQGGAPGIQALGKTERRAARHVI